jgi:hypothetical protein
MDIVEFTPGGGVEGVYVHTEPGVLVLGIRPGSLKSNR